VGHARFTPLGAVLAGAVILAACGGGATTTTAPAPTDTATASPSPVGTLPPPPELPEIGFTGEVPADHYGMHVLEVASGVWPDVPTPSIRLWDSVTSWREIQLAPGTYDWKRLDKAVAAAEKKGASVQYVFGPTPEWAATDIKDTDLKGPGSASPPLDLATFETFVNAVVKRYQGRIESYQVWNEANLTSFWRGSPDLMADMTRIVNAAVDKHDPDALVVAASTTTRIPKTVDTFYEAYLAGLAKRNWPVDVLAVHAYPAADGTPATRVEQISDIQGYIKAAGAPDLPLWETEVNFGLPGPGKITVGTPLSDAEQAAWLAQAYFDALRTGVTRVYWFAWAPKGDLLGITTYPGTAATKAYATIQEWTAGATWQGCTQEGTLVTCALDRKGTAESIVWVSGPRDVPSATVKSTGEVCALDGTCAAATGEVTVTASPVLLRP